MLPRRRNVASESEKALLIDNGLNSYSKLDKKGYSKPYNPINRDSSSLGAHFGETEITFDFLEEVVYEPVMAARDRTKEFVATVRSLQGRTLTRPIIKDERKAAALATYSQFMSMAKVISKNITSTYTKLEKLAMRMYLYFKVINIIYFDQMGKQLV